MNVDPQNFHCTQQGNFFGYPDAATKLYHDSVVWRGCYGSVHQDQRPYPQIYSTNPRESNGSDIYHKYSSVHHEPAPGFVRSIHPHDGVIGVTDPALSGQYRGQPAGSVTQNTLQAHRLGPNHPAMDPGAPYFTPTHSQSPLAGFMPNFALPLDDESIMESHETRARSLPSNLQKLYATLGPKIRDPLTLHALISILHSEEYRMHHVSDEELSKLMHIRDQPKAQSGKGSKISILEYRCLLCHRFLTVKKHQAREHVLNHLEVKPIACLYTQCEKRFLRSYDAARHQGRVHQVMKPLNTKGGSRKAVRRFVLTKYLDHQYYYDEPTTDDPEVPLKLRHGEC
ncbi:hypothetical protein FRC16_002218 [Serendipita sp. 398]|nr:hypothetical protein FRC16_002218 [Serendipita sp. 398]